MSQPFVLQIITPTRTVLDAEVISVSCPGSEGRFQVLHNHAPMLAELETGRLDVDGTDGVRSAYAVSGGVAQVFHNRVVILADSAEFARDIDVARAEDARKRAERRLQDRQGDIDTARADAALLRAVNRLKIAQAG